MIAQFSVYAIIAHVIVLTQLSVYAIIIHAIVLTQLSVYAIIIHAIVLTQLSVYAIIVHVIVLTRFSVNAVIVHVIVLTQLSEISPWIDGTLVYGPNKAWADTLRSFKDGLLAATNDSDVDSKARYFPAYNDVKLPMINPPTPREHKLKPVKRFYSKSGISLAHQVT